MLSINEYIKENDTDNVILAKLKELATTLTGETDTQSNTVAEVIGFINNNYTGGNGTSSEVVTNDDIDNIIESLS